MRAIYTIYTFFAYVQSRSRHIYTIYEFVCGQWIVSECLSVYLLITWMSIWNYETHSMNMSIVPFKHCTLRSMPHKMDYSKRINVFVYVCIFIRVKCTNYAADQSFFNHLFRPISLYAWTSVCWTTVIQRICTFCEWKNRASCKWWILCARHVWEIN